MSLRSFILGLATSFGIAWLAVIVIPFFKMRNVEVVAHEDSKATAEVFFPKRSGRIANGAEVYAANGCYHCHTQLVRPTYAGNDMHRVDWGGLKADKLNADADTRRETVAQDYMGESYAHIGITRVGPDLSNFGRRLEANYLEEGESAEAWIYAHLYRPRNSAKHRNSACPPHPFFFKKQPIRGQGSDDAIDAETCEGYEIVPESDAKALASYLRSLKKDQPVPAELNFSRK